MSSYYQLATMQPLLKLLRCVYTYIRKRSYEVLFRSLFGQISLRKVRCHALQAQGQIYPCECVVVCMFSAFFGQKNQSCCVCPCVCVFGCVKSVSMFVCVTVCVYCMCASFPCQNVGHAVCYFAVFTSVCVHVRVCMYVWLCIVYISS